MPTLRVECRGCEPGEYSRCLSVAGRAPGQRRDQVPARRSLPGVLSRSLWREARWRAYGDAGRGEGSSVSAACRTCLWAEAAGGL